MGQLPGGLRVSIGNTPQARDDYFAFTEESLVSPLALDVLANDGGGSARSLFAVFEGPPPTDLSSLLNGYPAAQNSFVSSQTGATISIDADGTVHYDPSTAFFDYASLADGEQLVETITYLIQLANGAFSVATTTVSIDGAGVANEAPVTTDGNASTDEDTAVNGTVVDNTTDVDNDPETELTYSVVGLIPVGLTFNPDGTYVFDPAGLFEYLNDGESAEVQFQYKANDGADDSNVSTVTVTVNGINDAPAALAQLLSTNEDTAVMDSLTATDVDSPDVDFALVGAVVGGTVTAFDAETGGFTFTPTPDFSGIASFQFTASDGVDSSAAQTITIDVAPVADTPTLGFDFTPQPLGDEFMTHQSATSIQQFSALTALNDGGFVAVWSSEQDGNFRETYARIFNADGTPAGNEFRVNQFMTYSQTYSAVATLADGDFVVSWSSATQETDASQFPDLHSFGVYARRYHADGTPVGDEFHVNTYTASAQYVSTVAPVADGGFVITWTSNGQDGSGFGIYGQRYDSTGSPVGTEFRINETTAGDQQTSWTVGLPDGGFVTVWQSAAQDGSGTGIFARIYESDGTAGSEFQINDFVASDQSTPSVAALADGGFVVSWESIGQDGSGAGMFARRFDADGNALDADDIAVNIATAGDQRLGAVIALPDGGFVVSWVAPDASNSGVYGRRFDADGNAISGEFLINQTETGDQVRQQFAIRSPLALLTSGELGTVWDSNAAGTPDAFARLFSLPGIGEEDYPIVLPAITTALGEIDGSETLALKLSDFPVGATFSLGSAGTGDDAGKWVISDAAEIASLAVTPLTMTPPQDFIGTFTLIVDAVASDNANLSSGPASDVASMTASFDVVVMATNDAPQTSSVSANSNEDEALAIAPIDANGLPNIDLMGYLPEMYETPPVI